MNDYNFSSYTAENLNWQFHFHKDFELCLLLDGEMCITIGDIQYNLRQGEGVVIFPGQIHKYVSGSYSKMHIITFLPAMVQDFYDEHKNKVPLNSRISVPSFCVTDTDNTFIQKGFIYSVLGMLTTSTSFTPLKITPEGKLLTEVIQYIEENYMNSCSLKNASLALSYGYSYISRAFKRIMNMSYTEYLNMYRINKAVYILTANRTLPIQEAARQCGYDSLCSFNRNFKSFTGVTPRELIKGGNHEGNYNQSQ